MRLQLQMPSFKKYIYVDSFIVLTILAVPYWLLFFYSCRFLNSLCTFIKYIRHFRVENRIFQLFRILTCPLSHRYGAHIKHLQFVFGIWSMLSQHINIQDNSYWQWMRKWDTQVFLGTVYWKKQFDEVDGALTDIFFIFICCWLWQSRVQAKAQDVNSN